MIISNLTCNFPYLQEVARVVNESHSDDIHPFSTTTLADILTEFSSISVVRVVMGYVLMLVYACMSLMKWSDAVQSQSGVGICGVLLVSLSVAAGLGFCSVLGIKFNASTTQVRTSHIYALLTMFTARSSRDLVSRWFFGPKGLKNIQTLFTLTTVATLLTANWP